MTKKIRILIAEDEKELTELYADAFEAEGFEVTVSNSGAGAASRIQSQGFDVILSDINMPGVNGLELIKLCRQSLVNMKTLIVLVSGEVDVEATALAMKSGIKDVFVKPVKTSQLIERIKQRLGTKS